MGEAVIPAAAWNVAAGIASMYRPTVDQLPVTAGGLPSLDTAGAVASAAAVNGDEHAIKFAEVAFESHHRGSLNAPAAARTALSLIR